MDAHGVISGKSPVQFSHLFAHPLLIIIFPAIASFCTPRDGFSDDQFYVIKLRFLTLVNPLNHSLLRFRPVDGQIE